MSIRDDDETVTSQRRLTPTPTPEHTATGARARLVILAGAEIGRKYTLEGTSIIGRSNDAAIFLDDPEVSRKHAQIRQDGAQFVLEDFQSRNGTLVNGIPVDKRTLAFGDKIQLGSRSVLLFTLRDPREEQILQQQRLEALGRLGAGIAHDFNNMLGAVMASLDFLRNQPADRQLGDPEILECFADIQAAAGRAAELTPRLLAFARGGNRVEATVDVATLCSEVVQLAQRTFDRSIRIVPEIQPQLVVTGDRVELHQVLMNLCLNARDAMPTGGTLTVGAKLCPYEDLADVPLRSTDSHVVVTVEDTGAGMDAETRERIFEPFFTTKRSGTGFGLGLATVSEVVTSHGGYVEAESELDRGAIFRVYLPADVPVRRRPAHATVPKPAAPRKLDGGGVILLVDDEEVVRRSTGRILRQAGHTVIAARDGIEALELYAQASPRPDLVLLDVDMPNLGGDETQRRLRALDPAVRVIFVSGHGDEARETALRAAGALAVLRKPCSAPALLDEINLALGRF